MKHVKVMSYGFALLYDVFVIPAKPVPAKAGSGNPVFSMFLSAISDSPVKPGNEIQDIAYAGVNNWLA
jgi:hypothetical protein